MGFEQFNNMLTVAAALSMAGWVARTPDYLPEQRPINGDNHEDIDYFGMQQQFWDNNNNEPELATLVHTLPANYDISDNFHDSKFITDFAPVSEIQELLSWEEAYRRGDLPFGVNTNYAFPYTYEGNNEHLFTDLQSPLDYGVSYSSDNEADNSGTTLSQLPNYYDDGYGSGSPEASDISSLLSLNLDDISAASSPASTNLLDFNDNGVDDEPPVKDLSSSNDTEIDVPGAVGYSSPDSGFDDIERLFSDDYYDLYEAFPRTKDEPPDTVRSRVSELEYASPLIDPNFDEYLGRFISPDQSNNLDTSFDDQFRMQFTDQPVPDGKFISDVLEDFEFGSNLNVDFPTPYEKALESEGEEVESETTISGMQAASQSSYSGPSTENIHSPKSSGHLLNEHDYAKLSDENVVDMAEEELMDPVTRKAVDALAHNFYKYHKEKIEEEVKPNVRPPPSQPSQQGRTYAPPSRRSKPTPATTSASSSLASKPCTKGSSIVYPDFPYTMDELIDMDVDEFNERIVKLDTIRQLLLKDMRKRGKNKYAARNCRKRKLDIIDDLDNNVDLMEKQKGLLLEEQRLLLEETRQIHEKTVWLNNYILERLFDENGNSYADSDYTLEYTTDGNVYLVPFVMKKETATS